MTGTETEYDGEGNIIKLTKGFGKNKIEKKSGYMKRIEEEERIKEELRQKRLRKK